VSTAVPEFFLRRQNGPDPHIESAIPLPDFPEDARVMDTDSTVLFSPMVDDLRHLPELILAIVAIDLHAIQARLRKG
jgi:hypothetical protein